MKLRFALFLMVGMTLLQACGSQCPSGYTSVNGSCTSSYYPTTGYSPTYTSGYPTGGYPSTYTGGYTTGYPTTVCPVGYPQCNGSVAGYH